MSDTNGHPTTGPVPYRNWRNLALMLLGLGSGVAGVILASTRWPQWWWALAGAFVMIACAMADKELDKPRRPR